MIHFRDKTETGYRDNKKELYFYGMMYTGVLDTYLYSLWVQQKITK